VVFVVSQVGPCADVVLDWNVTMLATLVGPSPFRAPRFAASTLTPAVPTIGIVLTCFPSRTLRT
jgi:hypothetical protein